MTEILPDPREQFLAQDPTTFTATDAEQGEGSGPGLLTVSVGLGAAYLVYRGYMKRKMTEEVRKAGPGITRKMLLYTASAAWNAFIPRWVSMTAPYLVAGYMQGLRDAEAGYVPYTTLTRIAEGYATELGNHINEVSAQAMLSGFQAQVNRKVPPAMAAKRVAEAYAVPKRGMNTLVNVWATEEPVKMTDQVLPSAKADRAQAIIEAQHQLRAKQIGNHEAWSARTQAKQIVWMYGVDKGIIPSSARRMWITAADERVCEICGPMDGVEAKVGVKFTTPDGGKHWSPPTHINCRCDVVLDLSVTEDIADEITALLESESVSKARPGDPYDRDRTGRFARTESRKARPYKEREAEVDALLDQVKRELTIPVSLEPKRPPDLSGPKLQLSGPRLSAPRLSAPDLSPSAEHGVKLRPKLRLEQPKLSIKLSPDLHSKILNTPIPDAPIETKDARWETLEHPLVAILAGWGENPVSYEDDIYTLLDANTRFYQVRPDKEFPDKYENSLQKAIGEIWQDWITEKLSNFYDLSASERSYYDDESGLRYDIDDDAYEAAVYEVANNIPREASEKVQLHGYGEFGDHAIRVRAYDIANAMGLFQEAADAAPQLMVVKHGIPGVTDRIPDTDEGIYRNPGKWHIIGNAVSERYLTHYPYQIHYAVPSDLLD